MPLLNRIDAILLRQVLTEYIEDRKKEMNDKRTGPITRCLLLDRIQNVEELTNKIFKK